MFYPCSKNKGADQFCSNSKMLLIGTFVLHMQNIDFLKMEIQVTETHLGLLIFLRGALVNCISNNDYVYVGYQQIMQKW